MDARASTAIYFLLARGERSHWHRIDAVEVWHYYAGDALALQIADGNGQRSVRLGAIWPPAKSRRRSCRLRRGSPPKHRRLDAGRLHRRAGIRFCEIRAGAEGLEPDNLTTKHRRHPEVPSHCDGLKVGLLSGILRGSA